MSVKRSATILLIGFAALITACSKSTGHACSHDSDCDSDQVCFVDGCGDPGKDIRAEITPNSSVGRYAQDVAVDGISARLDLHAPGPAILEGSIRFDPPPLELPNSTLLVALRGQGESELIPGVLRSFDSNLLPNQPSGSSYSLAANSGRYSVTASVSEAGAPPLFTQASAILRSGRMTLNLLFAAAPTLTVFGHLSPARGEPPEWPEMQVQALSDATTLRPVSQRVPVRSDGEFGPLILSPAVFQTPRSFVIQATPKDPNAFAPQKIFPPVPVDNPPALNLDMGGYGSAVELSGTILTMRGEPVPNATVYVEGTVGGGGTFRSQSVLTDGDGTFTKLTTLRSAPTGTSTLWVIPPSQSNAGILRTTVAVRAPGPLSAFVCPNKVVIQGNLSRADGSAAPGVRVVAVPIAALPGKPLPASGAQTTTDETSSFTIRLDPATYRLDFIPGEQLPRVSRFVTVTAEPDSSGNFRVLQLSDFTLSKGRRVSGNVYAFADPDAAQATLAPSASVRLFRLVQFDGKQSSVLLAETVSDGRGTYNLTLPTR